MVGEFAGAREQARRNREILEELGLTVMAATSSSVSAPIELLAGKPREAERQLRAGLNELRELGATLDAGGLAAYLADALYEQGRVREAWAALETATSGVAHDVVYAVHIRTVRSKLLVHDRRWSSAISTAKEAVAIADTTDSPNLRGEARFYLGFALGGAGENQRARRAFAAALKLLAEKGNLVSAARAESSLNALRGTSGANA